MKCFITLSVSAGLFCMTIPAMAGESNFSGQEGPFSVDTGTAGSVFHLSSAAMAEQKAICNYKCSILIDDPAIGTSLDDGGDGKIRITYRRSKKILPEHWPEPLRIDATFESIVSRHLKRSCEKAPGSQYEEKTPFCHLEPVYRDVYTFTDTETGVELIVPGEDNATLMAACKYNTNKCFFPEALDACKQFGYQLGKPLGLPTLRMVNQPGLMTRFKSSDTFKAMAQQGFWLDDHDPVRIGDQLAYDLETMEARAEDSGGPGKSMFDHGLVCAVYKF